MADNFTQWVKESKNKKIAIIIIIGIIAIIGLTFWPLDNKNKTNVTTVPIIKQNASQNNDLSYEEILEKKLTTMLSKMEGVGSVNVMVTIHSNEEKILAEDTAMQSQRSEEKDQAGGTRVTSSTQQTNDVVLQNGNTPYIVKEYAPEIRGVFILAEGADSSTIKNQIIEAVSRVLNVSVHKISVEKKKN